MTKEEIITQLDEFEEFADDRESTLCFLLTDGYNIYTAKALRYMLEQRKFNKWKKENLL